MSACYKSRLVYAVCARLRISIEPCGAPGCLRFTLPHLARRKAGILFNGSRLCGTACFRTVLGHALATAAGRSGEPHRMPKLPRMPFRLLLLKSGALSEAGLQQALVHAERRALSLADALLDLGLITDAELATALAAENGCAFYTLPPSPVEADAQLPRHFADLYRAATVYSTAERVLVGFVRKIDRELLRTMKQLLGREVEGCFITARFREEQLGSAAPVYVSEGVRFDEDFDWHEDAAEWLVRYAIRTGAEQISVGRVRDLLWIRSVGPNGLNNYVMPLAEQVRPSGAVPQTRRQSEKKAGAL